MSQDINHQFAAELETFFNARKEVLNLIKLQDPDLYRLLIRLFDLTKSITPTEYTEIVDRAEGITMEGKPECNRMMSSFAKLHTVLPISTERDQHHEARLLDAFVAIIDVCSWGKPGK